MRHCAFEACQREVRAKGLCNGHYKQQHAGFVLTPLTGRSLTLEERFLAKVDKTDSCWAWAGTISRFGYGWFRAGGSMKPAHRVSYELHNGAIPQGLHIDHTCHNRTCVNPTHLRPVTQKQNNENVSGPRVDNTSGVRGVHWNGKLNRWVAQVRHEGKSFYLGTFLALEEAEVAVIAKRNELFTHNDLDRS